LEHPNWWSEDVLSGKLLTQSSDLVLQIVQPWLLSEPDLSEMNRVHTEFIPTQDGLAFERNTLRELRWSRLTPTELFIGRAGLASAGSFLFTPNIPHQNVGILW